MDAQNSVHRLSRLIRNKLFSTSNVDRFDSGAFISFIETRIVSSQSLSTNSHQSSFNSNSFDHHQDRIKIRTANAIACNHLTTSKWKPDSESKCSSWSNIRIWIAIGIGLRIQSNWTYLIAILYLSFHDWDRTNGICRNSAAVMCDSQSNSW